MKVDGIEMAILVKDRPIPEYHHLNETYIEGRAGSNYELQVTNTLMRRVEVVVSVDGLSVTDGKEAGAQSRGYILEPNGTIRIPGWMLDNKKAAKFCFSGREGSYAARMNDGNTTNNGVIGLLAYAEKPDTSQFQFRSLAISASAFGPYYEQKTSGGVVTQNYMTNHNAAGSYPPITTNTVQQTLGTAFGESTTFNTRSVQFERGATLVMMSIYYDNLKGLRARGVPVQRVGKKQYRGQPNAFPGFGCTPPPGWSG